MKKIEEYSDLGKFEGKCQVYMTSLSVEVQ